MTKEICEKCNTPVYFDGRCGDGKIYMCMCQAKPGALTHHADGRPAQWVDENGNTSADYEYWSRERR